MMNVMTNINRSTSIQNFINEYIQLLRDTAPANTGALADSFEATIENTPQSDSIFIDGLNYAMFQNFGVNGTEVNYNSPFTFNKLPKVEIFQGIANQLGISPWAIAKSIFKKGIAPTLFISNEIDNKVELFADDYTEATWDDFYEDNKNPNK
jgi:hypothetical protein